MLGGHLSPKLMSTGCTGFPKDGPHIQPSREVVGNGDLFYHCSKFTTLGSSLPVWPLKFLDSAAKPPYLRRIIKRRAGALANLPTAARWHLFWDVAASLLNREDEATTRISSRRQSSKPCRRCSLHQLSIGPLVTLHTWHARKEEKMFEAADFDRDRLSLSPFPSRARALRKNQTSLTNLSWTQKPMKAQSGSFLKLASKPGLCLGALLTMWDGATIFLWMHCAHASNKPRS